MWLSEDKVPPNTVLVPKLIYHALTCADAWTLMSIIPPNSEMPPELPRQSRRRQSYILKPRQSYTQRRRGFSMSMCNVYRVYGLS